MGDPVIYDKALLNVETVVHLALPPAPESRDYIPDYLERASKGHWGIFFDCSTCTDYAAFFNATRAKFVNRIILLSSAEVYGRHQIPFTEDSIVSNKCHLILLGTA